MESEMEKGRAIHISMCKKWRNLMILLHSPLSNIDGHIKIKANHTKE